MCEPCGPASLSVKKISGAQKFPMRCSVCRKMTVNRAMKCFDCDYIYAIKPIDDPVAMEIGPGLMIQKCPECDSLNVGVPPGPVLPR